MNKEFAFTRLIQISAIVGGALGEEMAKLLRWLKPKSRPLENYYWGYIIPLVAKNEKHEMTTGEAHRFCLDECAQRDRFGRPISTSDADFKVKDQLAYVESVRMMMARDLGIETNDPDPRWKEQQVAA
jgi:hypothetical protein